MGMKVGQVALRFGANDFGSLMMEENVVSAAVRESHDVERDAAADRGRRLHAQEAAPGLHDPRGCRLKTGTGDGEGGRACLMSSFSLVRNRTNPIEPAFEILTNAGFSYEFYASSAHRQPEQTGKLVSGARSRGFKVIIAAPAYQPHSPVLPPP